MIVRRIGLAILLAIATIVLCAPALAPNDPATPFDDRSFAPPMRVHVWHDGALRAPFVYPQRLRNRIMREFDEDRSTPIALRWFSGGKLI